MKPMGFWMWAAILFAGRDSATWKLSELEYLGQHAQLKRAQKGFHYAGLTPILIGVGRTLFRLLFS